MATSNDSGAPAPDDLHTPVQALPRLYRLEQSLADILARLDAAHAELVADLAGMGAPPTVVQGLHRRHATRRAELVEAGLALRAIRHQLSRVLP